MRLLEIAEEFTKTEEDTVRGAQREFVELFNRFFSEERPMLREAGFAWFVDKAADGRWCLEFHHRTVGQRYRLQISPQGLINYWCPTYGYEGPGHSGDAAVERDRRQFLTRLVKQFHMLRGFKG